MTRRLIVLLSWLLFLAYPVYAQSKYDDPFHPLLPEEGEGSAGVETGVVEPPVPREVVPPPEITIQGILWGTDQPLAIIERRIYAPGDEIKDAEAKIHKIEGDKVVILHKNKLFTMGTKKQNEQEAR